MNTYYTVRINTIRYFECSIAAQTFYVSLYICLLSIVQKVICNKPQERISPHASHTCLCICHTAFRKDFTLCEQEILKYWPFLEILKNIKLIQIKNNL